MVDYANLDDLIGDYLPETRSSAEQAALGRIISGATSFIDSYLERPAQSFAPAPEEPYARYFRGEGCERLRLPAHVGDVVSVSASPQAWEWNWITESDWVERGGWLYRKPTAFQSFWVFRREIEYTVMARWGYEVIPPDISEACRQLVVHFFQRQRGTFGQLTPNGFIIERDMPPPVATILEPYRRKEYEVL